ncbi:AMP-binding protein [Crossiella sp. CA198]|uniref:AMP-binding protein n=1 Tax=Crossiella sp. CA198 TaxID=3455607 RepID=UPI003F8D2D03
MVLSRSAHVDTFCRDHLPPREQWPELEFSLPELVYPDRLNCAVTLLEDTIARHGADRPCLLSPTGPAWTYGQLRDRANQVARVLVEDCGLVPGNRVLLRGPNNPWLVACWFGVLRAGGVAVTTMPLLRSGELRTLTEIAKPAIALCDNRFLAELAAVDLPVIGYGGDDPADLTVRAAAKPAGFEPVATAADDVALLAFTSGTTGRPKATLHFHRDVLANSDTFARHVLRPDARDIFTGTPPLGFTFGLGGLVVFPLHVGAATLLLERATPAELADAVREHGVTVLFTAPTAYRAMLAAGLADRLRGLRRAVSAGEALPSAVWHEAERATGLRIIEGIGATELLHIFISAADDDIRPGATGRPVPGFRAEILDEHGKSAPDGVVGRLAVRGPTGCRYLDDERQLSYVQDGWNLTGDAYLRDADGYFWYQARTDDMIISSGYNIAGPEVENALLSHAEVVECGVVGAPDEQRGMVVHAYVVLAPGVTGDAAKMTELQDFVKSVIAPYKYPRVIEFLPELPRTTTGKLQRFRLRERAAAESGTIGG